MNKRNTSAVLRRLDLHQTISFSAKKASSGRRPLSTQALLSKSKVSVYSSRLPHASAYTLVTNRTQSPSIAQNKHFYEFRNVPVNALIRDAIELTDKDQKDINVYNNNYKLFPTRTLLLRNNRKISNDLQRSMFSAFQVTNPEDKFLFSSRVSEQQINSERIEAQPQQKQIKYSIYKRSFYKERKDSTSSKKRSSLKYCPWDLESGFGKKKRFDS